MDAYEVELEPTEPDGFVVTVPAVPGLLVLGTSVDDVLERARAAIAFHVGRAGNGCTPRVAVRPRAVRDADRGPVPEAACTGVRGRSAQG
jgi:predicted RNase H-like HicB family nuclease